MESALIKVMFQNIFKLVISGLFGSFLAMFPALIIEWVLLNIWAIEFNAKYLVILGFGLGMGFTYGEIYERNNKEYLNIKNIMNSSRAKE